VRKETNTSHVMEYGDLSIGKMKVSEFQGSKPTRFQGDLPAVPLEAVPSHDVPVMSLRRRIMQTNSFEESKQLKKELEKMLRNRDFLVNKMSEIIAKSTFTRDQAKTILSERFDLTDFECYNTVAKYFSENCFSISANALVMRYLYTFVNMCETGIHPDVQMAAMDAVCIHPPIHGLV